MIYATKEDLAEWLGLLTEDGQPDVSALPGDVDRMLRNASRVIDHNTLNQIRKDNEKHLDVAMNATTAQCEYWMEGMGESVDVYPNMTGYSAGSTSFQFTDGIPKLAPRARRELWLGGLLGGRVLRR